ncbi:MAG: hypothetical protein Q4E28_01870 [Clostridia bacterium]|nr:hypothetical protein [Clostridia bacterium]
MYPVSDAFKNSMKLPVKELSAEIITENKTIKSTEDLRSFKISAESGLLKTSIRKLEVDLIGDGKVRA